MALGGCTRHEQIDCTAGQWPAWHKCLDDHQSQGTSASFLACLPFSEAINTEGVWVVGFEKNDFFEGPRTPPSEVLWTGSTGTELMVDEKLYRPNNRVEALKVRLIGRRALCPMGLINPYPIIVQSLRISGRLRPST